MSDLIKRSLKNSLVYWIVITIIGIKSSIQVARRNNRLWDSIAPYGEDAFWEAIPPEVIDFHFAEGEPLPGRIIWQDVFVDTITIILIVYIIIFIIALLVEWFKLQRIRE